MEVEETFLATVSFFLVNARWVTISLKRRSLRSVSDSCFLYSDVNIE